MSAALVCSLAFGANAQAKKTTTVKTKTTTETAPVQTVQTTQTTQSSQSTNAGAAEQTNSGGLFSSRQESNGGDGIKATGGDITLEANVNLLSGNVSLSNSLNQVRARYFLSDDMAARLGAHISFNTSVPAPDAKTRAIEFSIAPGIEKHFAGTNRLSPYIGAELLLGIRNAHYELDGPNGSSVEVKGSFGTADNGNRGFFLVGLGAVGGFDFYVAKHLYLGYELGMELSNRSYSEIETITIDTNGKKESKINEGSSALSFGPSVRNGIRVGFVF